MFTTIITAVITFVLGAALAFVVQKIFLNAKTKSILAEAEKTAEANAKERMLQAKEKFLQMKSENEKVINERNNKVAQAENRIKQKEATLQSKFDEIQHKQQELNNQKEILANQIQINQRKAEDLEKIHRQQVEQLETISGLSANEAKEQLVDSLKAEAKTEAMSLINEIMDEAKMTANKEAKKIVIQTIQRTATEHVAENSVSVFNIESDEVKGRIIGREGRTDLPARLTGLGFGQTYHRGLRRAVHA